MRGGARRALPLWRRLLYSILPLLFLALLSTAVLALLQRWSIVDLDRSDEMARAGLIDLIRVERVRGEVRFENLNTGHRHAFPVRKDEQSLRVVLVGGSMAKGIPYVGCQAGDMARWMEALLQMRYPSRQVTVVNAGVGGMNSCGVVETIRRVARIKPDLVVVLSGNNEGYVPDAVDLTLHRWLVYRAMRKAVLGEIEPSERPPFYEQDKNVGALESLFRGNLERIVELSQRKRFELVLTTVPINLKWCGTQIPGSTISLAGQGFPSLAPDEYVDRGLMFCQRGQRDPAFEAFSGSERPYVAGLALGQCLEDMGDVELAMQTYRDLVQAHPMGRARPSYNDIVREVAAAHPDVILADADATYLGLRAGGVPDPDLFLDNCHMTAEGNWLVAREMISAASDASLIAPAVDEPRPDPDIDTVIASSGWTELYSQECPRGMYGRDHAVPLRTSLVPVDPPAMEWVRIDPGSFLMGTRFDEPGRHGDEVPHEVILTTPFQIGATEVTQAQWTAIMDFNPSRRHADELPVENVNWLDAVRFCNKLSEVAGLRPAYDVSEDEHVEWDRTSDGYRLPTEAEWEYACRADSARAVSADATQSEPNPWGLSGTLGGVGEWCWDAYGGYPSGRTVDPTGPLAPRSGPPGNLAIRVDRGGSGDATPGALRCTARGQSVPSLRHPTLGFRIARTWVDAP